MGLPDFKHPPNLTDPDVIAFWVGLSALIGFVNSLETAIQALTGAIANLEAAVAKLGHPATGGGTTNPPTGSTNPSGSGGPKDGGPPDTHPFIPTGTQFIPGLGGTTGSGGTGSGGGPGPGVGNGGVGGGDGSGGAIIFNPDVVVRTPIGSGIINL